MDVTDQATQYCRFCDALLVTDGLTKGDPLRCAACQRVWSHGIEPKPVVRRLSRQAVISLVCGLASMLLGFITGVPAVILGLLALLAMRRKDGLRGRGLAFAGIATGAVFGSCCGCYSLTVAWFISNHESTTDPVRVEEIRAEFCSFQLPAHIRPQRAERVPPNMRILFYADQANFNDGDALVHVVFYAGWVGFDRKRARGQLGYHSRSLRGDQVESRRVYTIDTNAGPREVTKQVKVAKDGTRYHNYSSALDATNGVALVIYSARVTQTESTGDASEPADLPPEVKTFFTSFGPEDSK